MMQQNQQMMMMQQQQAQERADRQAAQERADRQAAQERADRAERQDRRDAGPRVPASQRGADFEKAWQMLTAGGAPAEVAQQLDIGVAEAELMQRMLRYRRQG